MAPCPSQVWQTGASSASARATSAAEASGYHAPLPATMIGWRAARMRSSARSRSGATAADTAGAGVGSWRVEWLTLEDVAGHLDVGRSGPAGDRQRERVADRALDVGGAGDAPRGLGDRREGALGEVDLVDAVERLERGVARNGAGERDERRAGRHRAGDARDRVEGAWTGGGERDAGPAGQAAVGLGGQGGVVLMLDGHVGDPAQVGQAVVERQDVVAVEAEHDLDAVGLENLDRGVARRDLRPVAAPIIGIVTLRRIGAPAHDWPRADAQDGVRAICQAQADVTSR